jgi:hypothetical protein
VEHKVLRIATRGGAPTKVIVAESSAAALTVWNAPDVMIGGEMVSVVVLVVVASAVTSALTTNCCRCGSVALVTGLTANTAGDREHVALLDRHDGIPPIVLSDIVPLSRVEAQVVDCVPLTIGVVLSRVPTVCVCTFCDEYVSILAMRPRLESR